MTTTLHTSRFAIGLMLFGAGCAAVGPDYQRPGLSAPATFAEGSAKASAEVSQVEWWRDLGDAKLNSLVDRGLAQNLSIKSAIERIAEADAAMRGAGVASAVSHSLSASSTRSGVTDMTTTTAHSGAYSGSFVLDIFGGQRRAVQQAQAQYDAANYDVGTARLAFLASLAGAYVDARYYQEALALTRQTISTRAKTLDLVKAQQGAGTATELDRVQSQALLEEARATLPNLESGFNASVYAIATLLAEPAAGLLAEFQKGAAQPRPKSGAEAGVPADLLRNRPDVQSAERAFAAAVANVGVAEAAMYPSLTLSGTVTHATATSWSFGPMLALPVLSQSRLKASRDQAISQARQAELAWRAQVLTAVEETQAAQSRVLRTRRALTQYQAAASSYGRALALSRETYSAGTTTLLTLLDAERSRASVRLSVAGSTQALANNWIALQVAAGHGWAAE